MNRCIYDNKKKDFSNCTKNIEYKSGDLHYSIQHATLNISGQKISDTTWNITINMSDKYDFTEFRIPNRGSDIANDIGFMLQHTGMLYDYYWDVTSFTHRYSYVWAGR